MSRFIITRFLLPLLAICLIGVGVWMGQIGHFYVSIDSSADRVLASDPRNLETYQKVSELMPETEMVLIALKMENLFSDRGAHIIARTSQLLMKVEGAVDVKSLTHSGRPVRKGFQLDIEPFIPLRANPEEWEAIEEFTTAFPLSRNVLVSEDARYAILVGVYERELAGLDEKKAFRQDISQALEEAESVVEKVHVLAFPFLEVEGIDAVQRDLKAYALWASLLILGVLLLTFRSLLIVVAVLLWEGLGVGILLGVFTLFGQPIDIYTGILFPLIGGLQLTFVVHYLSSLQRHVKCCPPPVAAGLALREVFPSSALAAITTMAGLMALAFSEMPTLQAFGRIGVPGVALTFLFTFFLPVIYGARRLENTGEDRLLKSGLAFPKRLAVFVSIGMGVAMLGLTPWIFFVRTDIRAVEFIQKGNPIRESIEVLNQDLGGTNIFQVRVDTGEPRGLQTLPMLQVLEDIRTVATQLDGVTDAYAYSQLYMGLNQIWQGGDRTHATLPTSRAAVMLFSQLLNTTPLLFEESFVDAEARSALMILRSKDMPAREYLTLLEQFMEEAITRLPEGVTLEPVNGLHTLLEGDQQVVDEQVKTLGISMGLIGLLLAVLWRSLKLAMIVLLANLPALLAIFGGMGITGFPLNSITVMIAAVILGIAVDDGIHFVGAFRRYTQMGYDPMQAAGAALNEKLKPMACTSALLAVFLGLFVVSSFPPVAHFGILGALGIAVAFVGAVAFLPALIVLCSCQSDRIR